MGDLRIRMEDKDPNQHGEYGIKDPDPVAKKAE